MATEVHEVSASTEKFKVEETTIDHYVEEDRASSVVNEFGHGTGSWLTAYANVVCVVAGTGTLGLPYAFNKGGWLGILILMLAYSMAVYSGIILIRCLYYKPGHRLHDYKEIGTAAFGFVGYIIASFLHILNLFGCPALYLVLAGSNMHELLKHTAAGLTAQYWSIIFAALLLIPSVIMKTLREVTSVAVIGALSTMIAVFIIMIYSPIERSRNPNPVEHEPVIWVGFPTALSTIAFSFGGNNTYPHVEHALAKPHQWKWAVTAGLSTCTALYVMTAVPGYWSYGSETKSPIYMSFAEGSIAQIVAMIVMTIHVILAIPIYTTSFSLEFEKFTRCHEDRLGKFGAWLGRAIIRTATMVILALLAVFVPFFDNFMSLIGALANCGLVFLLPVLCYLKLTGVRNKPWYELAFCALTLLLGIVGCVFGTKDAIQGLIASFANQKSTGTGH
ncbi:hypothetical protein DFQ28_000954 [Apophysomyces sp. BC1034]|nr:hypothetical protein DFQ30_008763 [Apophysomyces sp. BC1015]KAG0183321.1 hypothetical protein DFQ29_006890 [Apophysomyces sp. BC1021]KAG0194235.1 hypothetical protein DFQ28_000954 [Apophysomyces sp. BC1034]